MSTDVTEGGGNFNRRHAALFAAHAVRTRSDVGLTASHARQAIAVLQSPHERSGASGAAPPRAHTLARSSPGLTPVLDGGGGGSGGGGGDRQAVPLRACNCCNGDQGDRWQRWRTQSVPVRSRGDAAWCTGPLHAASPCHRAVPLTRTKGTGSDCAGLVTRPLPLQGRSGPGPGGGGGRGRGCRSGRKRPAVEDCGPGPEPEREKVSPAKRSRGRGQNLPLPY